MIANIINKWWIVLVIAVAMASCKDDNIGSQEPVEVPDSNVISNLDFEILSEADRTVEVARNNWVTGDILIPDTIVLNNKKYTVVSIGDEAFSNCRELNAIKIPNTVKSIGKYAFAWSPKLRRIELPNSVEIIRDGAMSRTAITSIDLPNSLDSLGRYVFSGCDSLVSVSISCEEIPEGSFSGLGKLTTVTLGNSVRRIGDKAFDGCKSLKTISIPNSVETIGYRLFYGCESLSSVNLGSSVRDIQNLAFEGCLSLETLKIPVSVSDIEVDAFHGSGLKKFDVDGANKHFTSKDGIIYNKNMTKLYRCPPKMEKSKITVPSTVISIHDYGFYECGNLTSIDLGNSLDSIGDYAFTGAGIESIEIPASVSHIALFGISAPRLKSITVDSRNEYYSSVDGALYDKSLSRLILCPKEKENIIMPSSVKKFNWNALLGCHKLVSLEFGDSVTNFYVRTFNEYNLLYDLEGAHGLTSLKTLKIGKSMGRIVSFADSKNIEKIYCKAKNPPVYIYEKFVPDEVYENATLYVPIGCKANYESPKRDNIKAWGRFKNIQEMDFGD